MATSSLKTILVTGANRGIGYAIAEGIAKNIGDYQVIITSREKSKADEAAKKIEDKYPAAKGRIFGAAADIGETATVDALKSYIQQTFGSLDVIINNAGVLSWDDLNIKETEYTMRVNVLGTIYITEQLLPLVNKGGKVINLGSSAGCWGKFAKINKELTDTLLSEKNSVEDLVKYAEEFISDVKSDNYKGKWGTKRSGYCFSKFMVNIYSRNITLRPDIKERGIQVYAVCPGWCQTDMGGSDAAKTADQGADTPLYLLSLPFTVDEKIQGKFIREREVADWEVSPYAHDNEN